MRRSHPSEAVLITSAPEHNDDGYDRRRKKYAIMMALRAICVLAAALTYSISIALAMAFVVGGIILPWCAVIIANDRPAKRRARRPRYGSGYGQERALPASGDEARTVDG
jgi:Flp pilus assembly protein TadB